jgi:pyrroloquinoline quinone biosynthesis protein E
MNGWDSIFLTVTPDGTALPCHGARQMPVQFPNVRDHSMQHIWYDSFGFNRFRGAAPVAAAQTCNSERRQIGHHV